MEISQIKQAKELQKKGETFKNIEESIGISRTVLPHLIELYDLLENRNIVQYKNCEYVRIKKKRYMLQKIKLQHRIADIRKVYIDQLRVLTNKRKKLKEYLEQKENYDHIEEELHQKQTMLDITSKNLQHAEDGYEYIKRESNYNKAIYFLGGIGFVFFSLFVFKMAGGEFRLFY